MALGMAVALRNARLDQITTRAGSLALLRIYKGSKPATGLPPADPVADLLAQLTCNSTFAGAAAAGVLTLNQIQTQTSASNTGAASWFRIVKADGTTHVLDGTVSTVAAGTGDLQLDDVNIVAGGTVAISSAVITEGNP
jgi:hypothetical protein